MFVRPHSCILRRNLSRLTETPKTNIRGHSKESHKPEGAFRELSAFMLIASDLR